MDDNKCFKKRMDDLGRIVIPKQIRDRCKIRTYDEVEISEANHAIIIRKKSVIDKNYNKIRTYLALIKDLMNIDFIIFNNNNILLNTGNEDLIHLFSYDKINTKIKYNDKNVFIKQVIINQQLMGYLLMYYKEDIEEKTLNLIGLNLQSILD